MVHHGRQIGRALHENDPGDAEGGTGWRGALQTAADHSRQDPEILRIADEIYRAAADITTTASVGAYARSTSLTVSGSPARSLLHGMLDRLEPP